MKIRAIVIVLARAGVFCLQNRQKIVELKMSNNIIVFPTRGLVLPNSGANHPEI